MYVIVYVLVRKQFILAIDIPIVHGYAALVANVTDVVSFCFLAVEMSVTKAHPIVRPLHSGR